MLIHKDSELQRVLVEHGDDLVAGAAAVAKAAPQVAERLGLTVEDSVVATIMGQVRDLVMRQT